MIKVYENSVQNITKSENSTSCFISKKRFLQLKSIGTCFKPKLEGLGLDGQFMFTVRGIKQKWVSFRLLNGYQWV